MLQVSDIPSLAEIAGQNNCKLMVDNTFTPMILAPNQLGAHVTFTA
jgi:methionine-gamma-lyase